ncbi:MAG TPA: EVE domain-containing protein [Pseudomonas xinjiangensis]|uniref:EVE domain-containing protein n=2 Tax=root TaxID=1 RepID=A0A7V1FRZ6_9GAMM|nr:EVE domain-containing protein [Halopseudomonas xinjiangensis]HEC48505.1 EVE domain-containing protein [Halopseudomonas xinjiangensis]
MQHWLMKSEPDAFSIADLAAVDIAPWDGVRSYQARNLLEQMEPGDLFFFYHSSCQPPGLVGIGEIICSAYSDRTALDPLNAYYDPKSSEDRLPWRVVDVRHRETFATILPLHSIRELHGLEDLALLKRGNRLSVMPVTSRQWEIMAKAARAE